MDKNTTVHDALHDILAEEAYASLFTVEVDGKEVSGEVTILSVNGDRYNDSFAVRAAKQAMAEEQRQPFPSFRDMKRKALVTVLRFLYNRYIK